MCALKGFQILASNAKCTYLRRSVGTLLYLSIRGVQGVNKINIMSRPLRLGVEPLQAVRLGVEPPQDVRKLLNCQSTEPVRLGVEPPQAVRLAKINNTSFKLECHTLA